MSAGSTGLSESEFGPLVVKPKTAWKMLGCGNTRGYELLAAGELDSFLDGRSRKITVASISAYITRRLGKADIPSGTGPQPRRRGRPRKSDLHPEATP
jgi:hypothetical protein